MNRKAVSMSIKDKTVENKARQTFTNTLARGSRATIVHNCTPHRNRLRSSTKHPVTTDIAAVSVDTRSGRYGRIQPPIDQEGYRPHPNIHCRIRFEGDPVHCDILRSVSYSTLAILRRQEGRMSLTIDDLCQSLCSRGRTAHATPARRHHIGLGPVCTTLFASGLCAMSQVLLLRAIVAPGTPIDERVGNLVRDTTGSLRL